VIHPKTRETIFPGLALGTELGWGLRIGGPTPQRFGTEDFKYIFHEDPDWDWRTFERDSPSEAPRFACSARPATMPTTPMAIEDAAARADAKDQPTRR
jgi:hypothetical protein